MQTRCSLELPHTFHVREEDVEKLYQLFRDRIGNVEVTADCVDDATREFKDAKELVSYENPKHKEIRRILEHFQWGVVIAFLTSLAASLVIALEQAA